MIRTVLTRRVVIAVSVGGAIPCQQMDKPVMTLMNVLWRMKCHAIMDVSIAEVATGAPVRKDSTYTAMEGLALTSMSVAPCVAFPRASTPAKTLMEATSVSVE